MTKQERAEHIFNFLKDHLGEGFTFPALCAELGLHPGKGTRDCLKLVHQMAIDAGLHLPEAIAVNGFTYRITAMPGDAVDPALWMSSVAAGTRRREAADWDWIGANIGKLPDDLRLYAEQLVAMRKLMLQQMAGLQSLYETFITDTIKARKIQRRNAEANGG